MIQISESGLFIGFVGDVSGVTPPSKRGVTPFKSVFRTLRRNVTRNMFVPDITQEANVSPPLWRGM
ncbi:hypothetical protein R20233_03362 [Ralstonia sp. LMG 32965]|nr:hypothetical protein R20233_03362 [Ralstonia sp. LMG 32965]